MERGFLISWASPPVIDPSSASRSASAARRSALRARRAPDLKIDRPATTAMKTPQRRPRMNQATGGTQASVDAGLCSGFGSDIEDAWEALGERLCALVADQPFSPSVAS